jgi:PAS domain-containing protein
MSGGAHQSLGDESAVRSTPVMARDAPARQVHELALCESRQITEVFLALTEHSFESIALIAPDGTILYSAPSTARLLGYMTDELVSHNVFTYIHSA